MGHHESRTILDKLGAPKLWKSMPREAQLPGWLPKQRIRSSTWEPNVIKSHFKPRREERVRVPRAAANLTAAPSMHQPDA